MANCNKLFKEFDIALNVRQTKKDKLKISKNDLRERIRKDFNKNHPDFKPTFYIQGSFKLGTTIRTKDDECDIDDGVYFLKKPTVTGTTLQNWVKSAVTGATSEEPEHKEKCIRVYYKGDYHIDLPVYYKEETDLHPKLAVKNKDWEESDPKEFIEWFKKVKTEQLVRVIKYLKAWCDTKRQKMPNGLTMTVWAEKYIKYSEDRDDIALKETLVEMEKKLKNKFSCVMPTTPNDDLVADYEQSRIDNFFNNLKNIIKDADRAINEKNQLSASKLWQKHLGQYFPDGEDEDIDFKDEALSKIANTVLAGNAFTDKSGNIQENQGVKNLPHKNFGGK